MNLPPEIKGYRERERVKKKIERHVAAIKALPYSERAILFKALQQAFTTTKTPDEERDIAFLDNFFLKPKQTDLVEVIAEIKGELIIGLHGCSCHPFKSWEECNAMHKQKLPIGTKVKQRHTGNEGVVCEILDGYYYHVKFGKRHCDEHLEHSANLMTISGKAE